MKVKIEFPTAKLELEVPIEALTQKIINAIEQKLPVKISFGDKPDEKKEEPK